MAYTSKYTGKEIDDILDKASSGGGVTIVNSVDDLDPNASVGSLAVIAEPGNMAEMSVLDLPQSAVIDTSTYMIDATNCPQVSSIAFKIPEDSIETNLTFDENTMLTFTSDRVDLIGGSKGVAMGVLPIVENNQIVELKGTYADVAQQIQKEYSLFTIKDGVITTDQNAIDEFNSNINGLYYIGSINYAMMGQTFPNEYLAVYDKLLKVIIGTSSKAYIYQKKDNWEELYNDVFTQLIQTIEQKQDYYKIIQNGMFRVNPQTYHKLYINSGNFTMTLVDYEKNNYFSEYILEIEAGSNITIKFRDDNGSDININWNDGTGPIFEAGYTYVISIFNGFGVFTKFTTN